MDKIKLQMPIKRILYRVQDKNKMVKTLFFFPLSLFPKHPISTSRCGFLGQQDHLLSKNIYCLVYPLKIIINLLQAIILHSSTSWFLAFVKYAGCQKYSILFIIHALLAFLISSSIYSKKKKK